MPDEPQSSFDRSLDRLGKISGILVPIVIAFVGWFYTATKDNNDKAAREQQAAFDTTQKKYTNLTALVPLLTSTDKSQRDLGIKIYTSEANAQQAPTDELQQYIFDLQLNDPSDRTLQQAVSAGARQQQATAASQPPPQCAASPGGLFIQVANSPEQLALGKNLITRLRTTSIGPVVQGVQRVDKAPSQTQIRYYPSPANDQQLQVIRTVLNSVGIVVQQNVNLSPGYLKPGCSPPASFELWIGAATPLI